MNDVVLLLGSNLYDRQRYMKDAAEHIQQQVGMVSAWSRLYETEPWGFESELSFLNQVLICRTVFTPLELLAVTKGIEASMGRIRNDAKGYASRKIDIDILFYNDAQIQEEELTIPHPRLHERNFTLIPLEEVMPDFRHPVLQKSIQVLLRECKDELQAYPFEGDQDL